MEKTFLSCASFYVYMNPFRLPDKKSAMNQEIGLRINKLLEIRREPLRARTKT